MSEQGLMPFSAIAGNPEAKRAVKCLLVSPETRCMMVTGRAGTGKTALVRSIATIDDSMPVVNVPIGCSEDRLFGSIDIEQAVLEGNIRTDESLFMEADGGVLCIDDIDLMDIRTSLEAVETAITGRVEIERDGLSAGYDVDVSLVATVCGAVKGVDSHLLDRFDLCVRMTRPSDDEYIESIRNNLLLADEGPAIIEKMASEDRKAMEEIARAREMLPHVRLLKRHRDAIARLCVMYGVVGYRGPLACARAAVALAALDGRRKTSDDDVVEAAELALTHRRTIFEVEKKAVVEQERMPEGYDIMRFIHDDRKKSLNTSIVDKINEDVPVGLAGEEDEEDGEGQALGDDIEEIEAKVGKKFKVIDIMEAADSRGQEDDKRTKRFVESPMGRYSGARAPKGECTDIAIDATIRAAAPHQIERGRDGPGIIVSRNDLREKVRTKRVEQVFYFMVDSSGSLIIRNRISKVKAAVMSMLKIHYEKRDRVGLMTFNEERIEELMAPTRAVDEVSKAVESIKIGRGTPLSEAFMVCWTFVQNYTRRHPEGLVHIILFTDGKATKALDPDSDPCEESLRVASALHADNVDWIVVDTGLGTTKNDMPEKLADSLGGRFFLLDDLQSDGSVETIWTKPEGIHTTLPLWERDRARGYRRRGSLLFGHQAVDERHNLGSGCRVPVAAYLIHPFGAAGRSAEDREDGPLALLHGFDDVLLRDQGRGHQRRCAYHIGGMLLRRFDEILCRHIRTEVDDVVSRTSEHGAADILPDLVDVAADRPHDDRPAEDAFVGGQHGLEDGQAAVHGVGRGQDLREEDLSAVEALADGLHPFGQPFGEYDLRVHAHIQGALDALLH